MSKKVKRLYQNFKPDHYDLFMSLSDDKKSFNGSVTIKGSKTGRPAKRLTFHQNNLKISSVTLTQIDKKGQKTDMPVRRAVSHKTFNEIRLHTDTLLYPGEFEVAMSFSGNITKNMDGIYPSFFTEDGVEKQLIATQFESHHAREAFPCIDEPEAKATFKLTLEHSADETALSNTEIESSEAKETRALTTFAVTPIMSTYLLAFVVGEMQYKETHSKSGVKIRTYAVPSQAQNTDFALEVAAKVMDYYEDYYDIPFPLTKCDFIALPDFSSGAMENWGLITFREQLLLCDEHTSLETKQYIAIVVAHELTHQWFGNLVTMRWWTDLWLNEGFASWMEYLAIDSLFPEWELWTQFTINEQQTALKADALEHTHPIEVAVRHPDEIRTIFDIISYQKGASAIHMLYNYLGADAFRDGLRHYLKTHAYKNTDTVDLWQALEDVTKKPVKEFMGKWTAQTGFPILNVSQKHDHLVIEQRRFVANPRSKARSDKTLWPVPLLFGEKDITITKQKTNIPLGDTAAPIKLNVGQTGFYRVDYSPEMQALQVEALKSNKFSHHDRLGLLSDSIEVTRAGYQPVTEFLELIEHYRDETNLVVWEMMAGALTTIRQTLSVSDQDNLLRDVMKPFVSKLVSSELQRLGWEKLPNENHLDSLLRPTILAMSAGADDENTVRKALELYRSKIDQKTHIDPDIRGTVYSTAARLGGEKEFDELITLYKNTDSADERITLTGAITSFEQSELHIKTLKFVQEGNVKPQDILYWIAYSLMNRHSRIVTWHWIKDHWQWLADTIGTDLSFYRIPMYVARSFSDEAFLTDYNEFFTSHMLPVIERAYNQGVETLEINIEWRKRDAESALNWFKSQQL